MKTRKYKLYCDGRFIGFIFISDGHQRFPGCKVAAIWHFGRTGDWQTGDLELVERGLLQDLFAETDTDDDIIARLLTKAGIRQEDCRHFVVQPYA